MSITNAFKSVLSPFLFYGKLSGVKIFPQEKICRLSASAVMLFLLPFSAFASWKVSFDEKKSEINAGNGDVSLVGTLSFSAQKDNPWTVADSRDGVKERLALVDSKGNVQGYISFPKDCGNRLTLLVYHRTAQNYAGKLYFSGVVRNSGDSFACRARPNSSERVLGLSYGDADSATNDSIFNADTDTLLKFDASKVSISKLENNSYEFSMEAAIDDSAGSEMSISLMPDYYKNRYIPYYRPLDRKSCPKTPTGWMSWNTYFDKATAEDNLNEAKIGKKWLQPFGCDIWSIESWQGNSDKLPVCDFWHYNLEVNEKQFPEGMKKLADDIRALGFKPGIWMSPFGTGNEKTYLEHKDWFLHDKYGNPVRSWCGRYTLDPTNSEARKHLKNLFRTASRDWGYEFFKIDGMSGRNHSYCAHLYERPEIRAAFSDPDCENPFELCVQAFREGIGEDRIFLACQGHTSGVDVKYADACRTGADIVHPNQPVKWENVLNQAICTENQIFAHNIVSIADPDTLLVKDLPTEQARVSATVVALPGQLTFFGDKLAGLNPDQMKILQQTLPPIVARPQSLYPYFKKLPLWKLSVRNEQIGEYAVVAFFNWGDSDSKISASAEELGMPPNEDYIAWEFWTGEPKGKIRAPFDVEVPARGVRVLALHKASNAPQWISSDRHLAQCALELKKCKWNPETKTIDGEIEIIADFPVTEIFYLPDGFEVKKVESPAFAERADLGSGFISITFAIPENTEKKIVPFSIQF